MILHGLCGRFTRIRVDGKRNREYIYPVLNYTGTCGRGLSYVLKSVWKISVFHDGKGGGASITHRAFTRQKSLV